MRSNEKFDDTCVKGKCPFPLFLQEKIEYPWRECSHRIDDTCELQEETRRMREKIEKKKL